MKQPTAWPALVLLVATYLGLSLLYQRATPPLEASDEGSHFGVIAFLHEQGRLPVLKPGFEVPFLSQEMTQPPLYYVLAALFLRGQDLSDAADCLVPRPASPVGRADLPGYKNIWSPRSGRASSSGTLLAVQQMRGLSMGMGLGTILLVWRMARRWWPQDGWAAFLAAAWVAFNPMFLFITNSVNNDNLIILFSTVTFWWLFRTAEQPMSGSRCLVAGGLIGLAILAKTSGLLLLPLAGLVLVGRREQAWMARVRAVLLLALAAFAVCGWWFIRNRLLYGEAMAFRLHVFLAGNGRAIPDPWALLREWDGFLKSYWGVFGAFNVIYTDIVYEFFFGLTALAVGAVLVFVIRRGRANDAWSALLLLFSILNIVAVGYWTSRLTGSQGRLLFPSIAAHGILWVMSLREYRLGRVLLVLVALTVFGLALLGALRVIPAAYPP